MERIPYPIKPLGQVDVAAGFGNGLARFGGPECLQPYRFHASNTDGTAGRRNNYSFVATAADQIVLVWFTGQEFGDAFNLKPVQSITCEDLFFQKRAEKNGTSTNSSIFNTGGSMRLEVWWARTTRPMDHPTLTFVLKDGQDAFYLTAGISVFSDFRVPELPWDTSPPDIVFSSVPTSNTARTTYGHIVDNYYFPWMPYDFISYSDAMIGLDTDHPLLIDLTTFAAYLIGGHLFFPVSTADGVSWSGLGGIYLIGSGDLGFLSLISWLTYRRGEPSPALPGCVPPIPIAIPDPAVVPAVILAWPLEPDWADGVTERILWKTDVLRSQPGVEQRRRLRNTPRRQIDARFTLIGQDRIVYDTLMNGPAVKMWHYPLWWEKYHLTAAASAGATTIFIEDTTGSEVTSLSVMMLRQSNFTHELVTVNLATGGTLNLAAPLARAWAKGSTIYLTKLCRMTGTQRGNRFADRAARVTLTFDTIEPNDYSGIAPPDLGLDHPVLELMPNEVDDMTTEYTRLMQEFDNQTTSVPLRRDLGGQSFMLQQFSYMTVGRRELGDLRGFLYFLQGKLVPLYVPTYFRDVEIMPSYHAEPGTTALAVVRSGYVDFLATIPASRRLLMFRFFDGTIILHTVASVTVISDGQETLQVVEPFYRAISNTLVSRICWLALSRQDQDEIEILHHADGHGAATMMTTFATLADASRVAEPYMTMEVFNGSHEIIVGQPTPPVPDGPIPPIEVDPVPPDEGDTGGGTGGDGGSSGGGGGE